MTKRLKILIAIFLLLLTLVVFSLYQENDQERNIEEKIAIADTSSVTSFDFQVPGKEKVLLERKGDRWVLNDSMDARSYLINLFLTGINKMQVKREVSSSSEMEIRKLIKDSGVKISIYNKSGRQQEEFFLTQNPNDPNSTYYLKKGSDNPLVMFVPGFEGSLANIFNLPLSDWRTKLLFSSNERTLESVEITYPSFPAQGFSIDNTESGFMVAEVSPVDTARLYSYLNSFLFLTLNSYLKNTDSLQSFVSSKPPLAILKVKNLTKEKTIVIYEDKGRFIAYLPDQKEYVSLRQDLYSRILVKKDFFKPQNKQ